MSSQFGSTKIGAMQYNGVTIGEAMYNGQIVYRSVPPMPVVAITGTSGTQSQAQFRAACIDHGTTFDTVVELPFLLDTSNATNMYAMFYNCSALTTIPVMDTSRVTDMGGMFYNCSALTTIPVMDTSRVTNMYAMFYNCSALTTIPVMDTSRVTDMGSMFMRCSALVTAPVMDTSNVTNMYSMFANCSALTSVPVMNTSRVTDMRAMFMYCPTLTDGNATLVGKNPTVDTDGDGIIFGSAMTRHPFVGADGSITGRTLTNNSLTTLATYTITSADGAGQKTLGMDLAWGNATATKSIRIDRNGVQVAGPATGQYPTLAAEVACSVGDVITYKAIVNSTTTANRVISSGSWGTWVR